MRNECNIVRDILPLYAEEMTCTDTNDFIQEHLNRCGECRKELGRLTDQAGLETLSAVPECGDAEPIKAIQRKWNRKNFYIGMLLLLLAAVLAAYLVVLRHHPFLVAAPAHSEDVAARTWVEAYENPYEDVYLGQRFIIEFEHKEGKALQISLVDDYTEDEHGERIHTGYTLEVRETVFDFYGESKYQNSISTGYAYKEETLPPGFDFTITVKYQDQTVTYSMAEEGLFTPQ